MAFVPDIVASVLAHIVVGESVLAHIVVVGLVRTFPVCGHAPAVLRVLFPFVGMTVVGTVAGTVVVEVVAVEAVGGTVLDIVFVAEVVENSFWGGLCMAVLVAWLHWPYLPLTHVVPTLCALMCSCRLFAFVKL